jgi:hypothetical protein
MAFEVPVEEFEERVAFLGREFDARRETAIDKEHLLSVVGMAGDRGGSGFSGTGVSGVLSGQYSNRRADIHEKAET